MLIFYQFFLLQVEAELGRPVPHLTLLSYKTQVVAGINYFAKVDAQWNKQVKIPPIIITECFASPY